MGPKGTLRAIEAFERRQQRDAQKRQRELERRTKEQAKLSAVEQARLEVETHENQLEVLLSVHKEQVKTWDWAALAASLPPSLPAKNAYHELKAKQRLLVAPPNLKQGAEALVEAARLQDDRVFQDALQVHSSEKAEWESLKKLSPRILAGEHRAYTEALVEFSPLSELSNLGSSMYFTVHTAKLLECVLKVNGKQAIPAEEKSLTISEKLSVKPMSKRRFHEIYQHYLCGCVLRVAREVFAFLPMDILLITASADSVDSITGKPLERPVLSVAMPRAVVERLDYDQIDPSDALENFQHRGNFKLSRKSEAFESITPLTFADITHEAVESMGLLDLIARIQRMRMEVKSRIAGLTPSAIAPSPQTDPTL